MNEKKTLDALLRQAFEAGRERGYAERLWVENGGTCPAETFAEWRARIAE